MKARSPLILLGAVAVLAGCATVAPDRRLQDVQALTVPRTQGIEAPLPRPDPQSRADAQAAIQTWLSTPLSEDKAVRIALLNNPGLQARLAGLGVSEARRVQALTLPNPQLTVGRLRSSQEREIERSLAFSLIDLLTLPWRAPWQGLQLDIAVLQTAQDVLLLAADTRRAWLRAVTAEQVAAAHARMHEATETGAELARRMAQVGNWSRLQMAREQALLADSSARWARARLAAATEREQLNQRLGLWGVSTRYALASQLPTLPTALQPAEGLESTALRERLDLQAARRQLDSLARRQGWAGAATVFGDIGLAYSRSTRTETATGASDLRRGWELDLPLPLFDWGGAARSRAQAEVEQSAALLQEAAVRARSEVRSAWHSYRTAHDLARQQRDEVVPLRQFIASETTLRYNGMLASVWDLLSEARSSTQAVANALEAQRDFWLADTDLQLTLTGTSPGALQRLTPGNATPLPAPGH
ncbi:MAG: TolC family protein [Burkholderiaceae bacterium]|nr:TolC family protein [Burkholderiaceae bacterium]